MRSKAKKSQPGSSNVHVPAPLLREAMMKEFDRWLRSGDDIEKGYRNAVKKAGGRRIAKIAVLWDGRLLMGKRRDNHKWTIPGGHVDPQETMREGALRELYEETGIELDPRELLPLTDLLELEDRAGEPLCVQAYVVRLDDRPSTTMMSDPDGEVERWRWAGLSEGLSSEIYDALHVPPERCTVLQALNLVKKSDDTAYGPDNLEKASKAELVTFPADVEGSNCANCRFSEGNECKHPAMDIELVDGAENMCCDYWDREGTHHWGQVEKAVDADADADMEPGIDNLEAGLLKAVGLFKDTEDDDSNQDGYSLDIGSGTEREPGHLGIDLYPYDADTMVHDVHMGLPFPDGSTKRVRLVNSLHSMDELSEDHGPLLKEIHRVLAPGGEFLYEGPKEIYDAPSWAADYPGFVLTGHRDSEPLEKDADADYEPDVVRHVFTRIATPDPATADDAEPRANELNDRMLAADSLSYYWSDATSSGQGNRQAGYPSQGAMVDNGPWVQKDEIAPQDQSTGDSLAEAQVAEALEPKQVNPQAPKPPVKKSRIEKKLSKGFVVPILKAVPHKQIVYGVILAPNEIDAQEDFMEPEEIEKAAHRYLMKSRIVGTGHEKPIDAEPVESFIAPQDFEMAGQYGPQVVTKGSWVLGVKVHDPAEWQKVVNGDYSGFSVGGLGLRQET